MDLPWLDHPAAHPSTRDAALSPVPRSLHLVPADAARRAAVQDFIRDRFAAHYQADVRHFMPCLFGLEADDGSLHGAVGCRSAAVQPLFLERYLDESIEDAIAARSGERVERADVVEVGNLAARGAGLSRLLIVALTRLLAAEGVRWAGFTGTPALINSFRRLGIVLHGLAPADPLRLGVDHEQWRAEWGTYYDNRPQVMVAEVPGADRALATAGTYRHFGAQEAMHGLCS
ncbi:MAG TPA: thermostable hemolysin [Thauera sp.]|uniref:thermostable hemolysin n=1 Tax=Thauera sp. TaxID=1905334 RepID=UPI002CF2EF0E|nr:thermostable hemolysin [Thauera sp.]HRP22866.1 thermostable hemolysin [Thauera sp.]HRP67735.1 thermostable hemolysin [Thauera sp.]